MAVLVFEVLLNATSMFNHGNIRLPLKIDRILRCLIVTPEMHRVHHSVIIRETNSNFGFNLPWWDRLFGTYRDQPAKGHEAMIIGLSQFRDPKRLTLPSPGSWRCPLSAIRAASRLIGTDGDGEKLRQAPNPPERK
jgi:sterol desaturase/sphingolipid hydroxylase (fatty acid hydroxylase superfamily)